MITTCHGGERNLGGAVGLEGTKCGLWQSYESYFDMKPVVTLCHIMLYLNAYLTVVYKKP